MHNKKDEKSIILISKFNLQYAELKFVKGFDIFSFNASTSSQQKKKGKKYKYWN